VVVATFFARGFRGAEVFFAVADFLTAAGVAGATPLVAAGFAVARFARALAAFFAGLAASTDAVGAAGASGVATGADACTSAAGVATAAALDD